ncbi:MAG: DNA/RNA non-specific endonuclease [Lachnospiraceae bacterium]|nr:DNA/RNA non-specific endonuclease [Lachnospiraceae bacterium]
MPEISKDKELRENEYEGLEGYRKIKPEGSDSLQEANRFLDSLFTQQAGFAPEEVQQENPHKEVVDGKTYYYDDNGKLYRVDKELEADTEYEINGYTYKTDEHGRIISARGKLHLKDWNGRPPIRDTMEDIGKGDQKETDERGHLIGDQFGGSNGLENMIPQDAEINKKDHKNFENELAKEVKAGRDVRVTVEPHYGDDSHRPDRIEVTYYIDGEKSVKTFPNN